MDTNKNLRKTIYITLVANAGTLSVLLAKFLRFPIFLVAPYLKIDFGEIPILILAMTGNASMPIMSLLIKELLSFIVWGTNPLALIADFIAVSAFSSAFLISYKKLNSPKRVYLAFLIATVVRVIVAVPDNMIILPLQLGIDIKGVMYMLIYIIPFNIIKSALDAVCIIPFEKRIVMIINRYVKREESV